ncbi:hypothetical protein PR048_012232 [Dryococelus australis]|uniref:Uncharacterized protein n=1 Tax=Dryococelus australis TaxID=614101 RepID=A0ABQ9HPH9_9NEOP|nr:hypothetical protein PR048_012232 [Dryococelus australis]
MQRVIVMHRQLISTLPLHPAAPILPLFRTRRHLLPLEYPYLGRSEVELGQRSNEQLAVLCSNMDTPKDKFEVTINFSDYVYVDANTHFCGKMTHAELVNLALPLQKKVLGALETLSNFYKC